MTVSIEKIHEGYLVYEIKDGRPILKRAAVSIEQACSMARDILKANAIVKKARKNR